MNVPGRLHSDMRAPLSSSKPIPVWMITYDRTLWPPSQSEIPAPDLMADMECVQGSRVCIAQVWFHYEYVIYELSPNSGHSMRLDGRRNRGETLSPLAGVGLLRGSGVGVDTNTPSWSRHNPFRPSVGTPPHGHSGGVIVSTLFVWRVFAL